MGEFETIQRIAKVSDAMSAQCGVAGSDIAGMIVSFLAVHPEHVERFMRDGSELFIDGTIRPEAGSLSYMAENGRVLTPSDLRKIKGIQQ